MLIFLDFDGVLHSAHSRPNATLFSQIPIFEQFFNQAEYADCQFVISSTWRINRYLDDLRAYFSSDFRQRIIGTTPVLSGLGNITGSREREILAWLRDFQREQETWIALDDMRSYFDAYAHHVYFCQAGTGLTERDLLQLAQHIAQFAAKSN